MRPAITAFDRGDDAAAVRVFMAANTSDAAVEAIPETIFQRFADNAGPLKAQINAGFPPFTAADARTIQVPTLLISGAVTGAPHGGDRPPGKTGTKCEPADHRGRNPQHVHQPPRRLQRRRAAIHPLAQRP